MMSEILKNIKKYFLKNSFTLTFSILALIFLIGGIISLIPLNSNWAFFNQIFFIFPTLFLFLFSIAFIVSGVLAYYEKYSLMILPIFFVLLLFTIQVRTSNISELKDVTTGNYTLGPDLDPFLYLRNAKEIISGTNTGNIDDMRYASIGGAPSYLRANLMPWTIIGIYKLISSFSEVSLNYAAIITPVILFSISLIGFFLFSLTLFSSVFNKKKAQIISIIASFLYAFAPQMLHRTTAGIPEIESLGMAFFWFAFLFFIKAWKSNKQSRFILFGALAGIFTGLMSFSWGGYRYIYMVLALVGLILFLINKDFKKNLVIFSSWIITGLIFEFIRLKNFSDIIHNLSGPGIALGVFALFIAHFILTKLKIKKLKEIKIPENIKTLLIILILGAIFFLILDPKKLVEIIVKIVEGLLFPFGKSRVGLTVAENKAPYFIEVLSSFKTIVWVFLLSTFMIFIEAIKHLDKKDKGKLIISFFLFLCAISFSRISSSSIMNGENLISQLVFILGIIQFAVIFFMLYFKSHKGKGNFFNKIKEIEVAYVLLLSFSFLAIISMRGAVRLFFLISPLIILVSSWLVIKLYQDFKENKDELIKIGAIILCVLTLLTLFTTFVSYANSTINEAKYTVPGIYEKQWQGAMSWVRENTNERDFFIHWWDYGYWVQTIGERPTITDGGHYIGYWDHLIGRYLLTTPYPEVAKSFMKSHNVSYLLIDSTDIGKYSAYSTIGNGNDSSDRASYVPVFVVNPSQIQETREGKIRFYSGGAYLDSDLIYSYENEPLFLPSGNGVLGAIVSEVKNSSLAQPKGIYVYNGKQYSLPIRYAFVGDRLMDFGSGINATVLFFSSVNQNTGSVDQLGAAMYLSEKVKDSLFAQMYLMNDPSDLYPELELAHSQNDPVSDYLSAQGITTTEFIYYGGVRGPIKIWKFEAGEEILVKEEFLRTSGEYGELDDLIVKK
jgi:asparagine N-glycosylation enzyme membrane subunit Stt3